MGADPDRWYPTKVDRWLGALLLFAPVMITVVTVLTLLSGKSGGLVALIGLGAILLLYGGLVFPMRYGLTDEHLIVRSGLIKQRIPLVAITEVYLTRSPLSAPALSLDRIYIRFGEGMFKATMISPLDREGFMVELERRAKLVRRGEKLEKR